MTLRWEQNSENRFSVTSPAQIQFFETHHHASSSIRETFAVDFERFLKEVEFSEPNYENVAKFGEQLKDYIAAYIANNPHSKSYDIIVKPFRYEKDIDVGTELPFLNQSTKKLLLALTIVSSPSVNKFNRQSEATIYAINDSSISKINEQITLYIKATSVWPDVEGEFRQVNGSVEVSSTADIFHLATFLSGNGRFVE